MKVSLKKSYKNNCTHPIDGDVIGRGLCILSAMLAPLLSGGWDAPAREWPLTPTPGPPSSEM